MVLSFAVRSEEEKRTIFTDFLISEIENLLDQEIDDECTLSHQFSGTQQQTVLDYINANIKECDSRVLRIPIDAIYDNLIK